MSGNPNTTSTTYPQVLLLENISSAHISMRAMKTVPSLLSVELKERAGRQLKPIPLNTSASQLAINL
jgi:hypothetical protein